MSLINDALKRAREAQDQAPPPPPSSLEFRPVDPAQLVKHGPSLTLIVTACIALILGGLLTWQWLSKSAANHSVVAKTAPPEQSAPPPATTPALPAPPPVSAPSPAVEAKTIASTATPVSEGSTSSIPAIQESAPVSVAASEPAPKPAPPRLQAIVFRRTRPSAIISGKTVFIGDKFGEWRVVAISQESATLVGGGQTNVLILPQ